MTDRYSQTFQKLAQQKRLGFCPFEVLGHPNEEESFKRIQYFLDAGADILELGIPFSDPAADGPTIQSADKKALEAGMTPSKALALIKRVRRQNQSIPIGLLIYANIVLQYGVERFYRDFRHAGGDSILIADVPLEELEPFAKNAREHHLHQIMIVSENTTMERLRKIEKVGSGFLYVVSTMGVTGARKQLSSHLHAFLKKLRQHTSLPLMVGFGISTPQHIRELSSSQANGAIVGSALVKLPTAKLKTFVHELRHACAAV